MPGLRDKLHVIGKEPELLEVLALKPARDIDVFTHIPPYLVQPLANVLWFSRQVHTPEIEEYVLQFMRCLVSMNRKGRDEAFAALSQKMGNVRETIRTEGGLK